MNRKPNMRFKVTSYAGDGGEELVRTIGLKERRALIVQEKDHLLDTVQGVYGFRAESGEWVERPIDGSGMGDVALDIIRSLQLNPGITLGPAEIAGLTGDEDLCDANALAARMMAIRKAHDESPTKGPSRLFVTCRNGDGGYLWPARFSWIWIDRVPPARPAGTRQD